MFLRRDFLGTGNSSKLRSVFVSKQKRVLLVRLHHLNPFVSSAPILYPLKTSDALRVRGRVHWEQMG